MRKIGDIIGNIEFAYSDFFPNFCILFLIGAASPIEPIEGERAKWLKNTCCSQLITDWHENDLNLIQMEWNSNNWHVTKIFIKKRSQKANETKFTFTSLRHFL